MNLFDSFIIKSYNMYSDRIDEKDLDMFINNAESFIKDIDSICSEIDSSNSIQDTHYKYLKDDEKDNIIKNINDLSNKYKQNNIYQSLLKSRPDRDLFEWLKDNFFIEYKNILEEEANRLFEESKNEQNYKKNLQYIHEYINNTSQYFNENINTLQSARNYISKIVDDKLKDKFSNSVQFIVFDPINNKDVTDLSQFKSNIDYTDSVSMVKFIDAYKDFLLDFSKFIDKNKNNFGNSIINAVILKVYKSLNSNYEKILNNKNTLVNAFLVLNTYKPSLNYLKDNFINIVKVSKLELNEIINYLKQPLTSLYHNQPENFSVEKYKIYDEESTKVDLNNLDDLIRGCINNNAMYSSIESYIKTILDLKDTTISRSLTNSLVNLMKKLEGISSDEEKLNIVNNEIIPEFHDKLSEKIKAVIRNKFIENDSKKDIRKKNLVSISSSIDNYLTVSTDNIEKAYKNYCIYYKFYIQALEFLYRTFSKNDSLDNITVTDAENHLKNILKNNNGQYKNIEDIMQDEIEKTVENKKLNITYDNLYLSYIEFEDYIKNLYDKIIYGVEKIEDQVNMLLSLEINNDSRNIEFSTDAKYKKSLENNIKVYKKFIKSSNSTATLINEFLNKYYKPIKYDQINSIKNNFVNSIDSVDKDSKYFANFIERLLNNLKIYIDNLMELKNLWN